MIHVPSSQVASLLDAASDRPLQDSFASFEQLALPTDRFHVALIAVLPSLQDDKAELSRRLTAAYILYGLYELYDPEINPFREALRATLDSLSLVVADAELKGVGFGLPIVQSNGRSRRKRGKAKENEKAKATAEDPEEVKSFERLASLLDVLLQGREKVEEYHLSSATPKQLLFGSQQSGKLLHMLSAPAPHSPLPSHATLPRTPSPLPSSRLAPAGNSLSSADPTPHMPGHYVSPLTTRSTNESGAAMHPQPPSGLTQGAWSAPSRVREALGLRHTPSSSSLASSGAGDAEHGMLVPSAADERRRTAPSRSPFRGEKALLQESDEERKARETKENDEALMNVFAAREKTLTMAEHKATLFRIPDIFHLLLPLPYSDNADPLLTPYDLVSIIALNPGIAHPLLQTLIAGSVAGLRSTPDDAGSSSSEHLAVAAGGGGNDEETSLANGQEEASLRAWRQAVFFYLSFLTSLPPTLQTFDLLSKLVRCDLPSAYASAPASSNSTTHEPTKSNTPGNGAGASRPSGSFPVVPNGSASGTVAGIGQRRGPRPGTVAHVIRTEVLGGFLANAFGMVERMRFSDDDAGVDAAEREGRVVRLLCLFLTSLLNSHVVDPSSDTVEGEEGASTVEIAHFAIRYSKYKDAHDLWLRISGGGVARDTAVRMDDDRRGIVNKSGGPEREER